MCTNEPEICNFISNDLHGDIMSIQKCDKCQDGYLIVKQKKDGGAILGCTNYTPDKKGCNNVVDSVNYEKKYLHSKDELLEMEIADEQNIEYRENKSKDGQKEEDIIVVDPKHFDAGENELQNKYKNEKTCEDDVDDVGLCDCRTFLFFGEYSTVTNGISRWSLFRIKNISVFSRIIFDRSSFCRHSDVRYCLPG